MRHDAPVCRTGTHSGSGRSGLLERVVQRPLAIVFRIETLLPDRLTPLKRLRPYHVLLDTVRVVQVDKRILRGLIDPALDRELLTVLILIVIEQTHDLRRAVEDVDLIGPVLEYPTVHGRPNKYVRIPKHARVEHDV